MGQLVIYSFFPIFVVTESKCKSMFVLLSITESGIVKHVTSVFLNQMKRDDLLAYMD